MIFDLVVFSFVDFYLLLKLKLVECNFKEFLSAVAVLIVDAQLATTKFVGNATVVGRTWDCGMSGNWRVANSGSASLCSGNTLGLELLLKSLDLVAQGIILVNQLLEQSRVVTAFKLHIFESILELFGDIDTS